ncbi:deoxyguanosine kinase [Mycoplasmopsis californica HAZ160_1]|uniref:Deoxyguanosine kinase n=2 Tax=Mycoplasmopsis californica TaxID=2113 RepID=A0AAT9F7N0_9BACT|nr:deoxynucleoside kinase [Mycoplasmopsis californica]BAP00896.1 deoxyguanosine kinase [Mycoplasmopsis californica HAZ160_1]BBG40755.1 deoxyguanosine kinase [Mycoplasmopsis californica]BBG41349.1 deoxyguanosine kinase [Mycoplasmopsis californica]BBG41942.1 deoxyguanosine kinase [Mycoplasmopsis californica]BBG43106.1 deoxyguanosine kinase [Mycoplasmopsis californica]
MLIGISGMIGSGKSVLSQKLLNYFNNSVLLKEFEEKDPVFNQFLSWLYQGTQNLSMSFQAYVIESHSFNLSQILADFHRKGHKHSQSHIFLDRFSIEHYIFAQVNLADKPKYLQAYKEMFTEIFTSELIPDLAIYLDINFDTFKKRLFSRGREVEIANYAQNQKYFAKLLAVYKDTFIKLANHFKMNYIIIDTNQLSEDEVFQKVKDIITNYDFSSCERANN